MRHGRYVRHSYFGFSNRNSLKTIQLTLFYLPNTSKWEVGFKGAIGPDPSDKGPMLHTIAARQSSEKL
jgi:hypothetical protein